MMTVPCRGNSMNQDSDERKNYNKLLCLRVWVLEMWRRVETGGKGREQNQYAALQVM